MMQSMSITQLSALPASPTELENATSIWNRPTSAIPTTSFSSDFFDGPSKVTLSLPPDFHAPSPRIALTPVSFSAPPHFSPTPAAQSSTITPTFVTDTALPPSASSTSLQFTPTEATFTADTIRLSGASSAPFIDPTTSSDLTPASTRPSTMSSFLSSFDTHAASPRSSSFNFSEKTESNLNTRDSHPSSTVGTITSSTPIGSSSSSTGTSPSQLSSRSSPTHAVIIAIVVCSGLVLCILLAGVFFCARAQSRRRKR